MKHLSKNIRLIEDIQISAGVLSIRNKNGPNNQKIVIILLKYVYSLNLTKPELNDVLKFNKNTLSMKKYLSLVKT
tara:strand:+ start:1180 stop:1404 length:225 start_codon:yes stop_codon:yes gene_type:complete